MVASIRCGNMLSPRNGSTRRVEEVVFRGSFVLKILAMMHQHCSVISTTPFHRFSHCQDLFISSHSQNYLLNGSSILILKYIVCVLSHVLVNSSLSFLMNEDSVFTLSVRCRPSIFLLYFALKWIAFHLSVIS